MKNFRDCRILILARKVATKKKNLRIFLFGLIIFIGLNMLAQTAYAENAKKAILGKWVVIGSTDTIEFFEEGTIILEGEIEGKHQSIIGDYRFLDQNRIRVEMHGIFEMAGPQVTKVSIDNDKLILNKLFDERIEFKRITKATQLYLDGSALYEKEKFDEAVNLFEKAAKLGEPEAQNRLGFMYYKGTGVEKNYQKAFKWAQKAASQKITQSQRLLGHMYKEGYGTNKNIEKSIIWFKEAADQGDVYAQNGVAWIYAANVNSKYRDGELAVKYAKMACSQKQNDWAFIDTLAAAYARNGQYDKAANALKDGMNLLRWNKNMSREEKEKKIDEAKIKLSLYQSGQAYDEGYDIDAEIKAQKERADQEKKRLSLLLAESKKATKTIKHFEFEWNKSPTKPPNYRTEGKVTDTSIVYSRFNKSISSTGLGIQYGKDWKPISTSQNSRIWYGDVKEIIAKYQNREKLYYLFLQTIQGKRLVVYSNDRAQINELYDIISLSISQWYDKYGEVAPQKKRPDFLAAPTNLPAQKTQGQTIPKSQKVAAKSPSSETAKVENTRPQSGHQTTTSAEKVLVTTIQRELKTHGYYKMKVDGLYGPGTAAAIKAYQQDNNLPRDGKPTKELLAHLESKKEDSNNTNKTAEPQENKKPGTIGAAFNEAVDEFMKVIFKKK